jgi:predicted secreted Zn-dependent protease
MAPPAAARTGLSEFSQAVVVVAVFAVVLLGILTIQARNQAIARDAGPAPTPPPAVIAGSVPRPSVRATAAATPTPEPEATATPTAAPVLPARAAQLDRGSWGVINADDVVIRTLPQREAPSEIIGAYDAGAYVQVLDGPELGSGYYWFFVEGDGPTGWVAAGTAAGAWIVPSNSPGTLVALPDGTVSIAGAEIVYYDITGSSPSQLREQVSRYGPDTDPGSDVIATALFDPYWTEVPVTETTDVGGVFTSTTYYVCDVSWRFEVTVPRWVAPAQVPQPAAAWWSESLRRIVDHEATHVRIWQDALPDLEARLDDRMDCYAAIGVLEDWIYQVDAAQAAFDADHGYLDWPSAPSVP